MVRLRGATTADVPLLEYWDTQPHVVAATGDDGAQDWNRELATQGPATETLIAELDNRAIGLIQIIDPAEEPTHYWGDVPSGLRAIDIWIGESSDLGLGYGTELTSAATDQ